MIVLRTLGSIDISAPGYPRAAEVLAQPKRFTLLAYIALTEPKGFLRRDSLLPLFWPEADQSRGRQVLRQTVYLLRQQLGSEAVQSRGGEELGVDPGALRCDAALFEAALAEGRTADALELYRGDFLAGLHVPDASPDLEEWISGQRRRLRNLAMRGAWALSTREEREGHVPAATFWAQRAVALDPTDEAGARDLMRLLARLGDRGGALRAYGEFARRLQEELGVQPGSEIRQVADELRRSTPGVASAPPAPPIPVPLSPVGNPARPARRVGSWRVAAVAVTLLLLAGGAAIAAWGRRTGVPLLAVGPITTLTVGDSSRLSTVTSDLLSTSVARLSSMRVIPVTRLYELQGHLRAAGDSGASMVAAAQQAGADQLLQGTVHRDEHGSLVLDVQIVELKNGSVVHAYRASGADLFAIVDDATTLVARGYGVPSPRERIAEVTTQSLVAYRLYVEGLQAYRGEDRPVAYRLFLAALNEDSTFAMAAYYAGIASPNDSLRSVWELKAAALANRATDRERLWILEQAANLTYSPAGNAVAETLAVRYPEDLESRLALGDIALQHGAFAAAVRNYQQVIHLDSLSLVATARRGSPEPARCLACQAYEYVFLSELSGDSLAQAERDMRAWMSVQPDRRSIWGRLGEVLARENRYAESRQAFGRSDDAHDPAFLEFEDAQLDLRAGDYPSADRRLTRLMSSASASLAGEGSWFLAISLRNQGRWREALALSRSHGPSLQEGIALLEMGRPRDAARFFRRWDAGIRAQPGLPGVYAKQHGWMLTHVATALAAAGDTAELGALADSIQAIGAQSSFGRDPLLHHYVRGLLWRARGDLPKAIDEFRASIWSWTIGYTRANYELARALVDAGRPAEAVYPLESALRGDLQSSNLWVTRTALHRELARAFAGAGRADSAAAHWRAVAGAWREGDPIVHEGWVEAEAKMRNAEVGGRK
ncbi:MAG TPA: BTAD domain-containing putative transcriptional regulator [Gemmatimonadales bacterium]|nr:BTAD domain-containing putative transcriptional regulator [Gemmatimonadales bacterium]